MEAVAGRERALVGVEVAGMDLGVGHDDLAVPVDEGHAVARQRLPLLQIGQRDCHVELARQIAEMPDKGMIAPDGEPCPYGRELLVRDACPCIIRPACRCPP